LRTLAHRIHQKRARQAAQRTGGISESCTQFAHTWMIINDLEAELGLPVLRQTITSFGMAYGAN